MKDRNVLEPSGFYTYHQV